MNNIKLKSSSTIWIIVLSVVATLFIVGLIATLWYFNDKIDKLESLPADNTKTVTAVTKASTAVAKVPSETPVQAAENFFKSIFDSFPGSKVDLSKAKKYLGVNLIDKVKDTKESYWDLHGYIQSGPCSASTSEISKSDNSATVEITTEWGKTCVGGLAEPYYRYKMSNLEGRWVIDEIEQLKSFEGQEQVPRDF